MMDKIVIYTDGGCRGNPGVGGWGVWLRYKDYDKKLKGSEYNTTNNKMELTAAIKALANAKATLLKAKAASTAAQAKLTSTKSNLSLAQAQLNSTKVQAQLAYAATMKQVNRQDQAAVTGRLSSPICKALQIPITKASHRTT